MRVAVAKAAPPPQIDDQQQQHPDEHRQPPPDPTVASEAHCRFCFDALAAQLCGRGALPASAAAAAFGEANCALFVTWNKRSHGSSGSKKGGGRSASSSPSLQTTTTTYHLRGCIGTLEPRPLRAALQDYALTSALRDRRFDPIAAREVPRLKVTVSLLRRFERASHAENWDVGTHGIIVAFADPSLPGGPRRSATFLPEVAGEQGWTRRQALEAAVRKSGYGGPVTGQLLAAVEVTRYQSTRWEMTYAEWRRWAKNGGGGGGGGGAGDGAGAGALVVAVEQRQRQERQEQQQQHHHHHHGSGAILRALRRFLRGGGGEAPAAEADEEEEDEDEDEEE